MAARVSQQTLQVARLNTNPPGTVSEQLLQVSKGFDKKQVTVEVQSYPKNNPISFFSRRGSKTFTVGSNFVRVSQQLVQVAYLRSS